MRVCSLDMSQASEQAQELWAAARTVAARAGADFSMDDVAFEAGVSRATAYRALRSQKAVVARLSKEGVLRAEDGSLRARLLAATREVVTRDGFDALTIAAVAAEAGCAPASVYRLFESREALLRAWGDSLAPRRSARALAVDDRAPLQPALVAFARSTLEVARASGGVLSAGLAASGRSQRWLVAARRQQRGAIAALREAFAVRVKRGELAGDPAELAIAFAGLLLTFGWLAPTIGEPVTDDLDALAGRITALFLSGARASR